MLLPTIPLQPVNKNSSLTEEPPNLFVGDFSEFFLVPPKENLGPGNDHFQSFVDVGFGSPAEGFLDFLCGEMEEIRLMGPVLPMGDPRDSFSVNPAESVHEFAGGKAILHVWADVVIPGERKIFRLSA